MAGFVSNYLRNLAPVALSKQPSRPLMFSYYVTHRCNLNCRYCCDGDGQRFKEDPVRELTTDEAEKLIAILRRDGDTLDFTGGEPMLRDDLERLLACAKAQGFRTILNTKGIGLASRPDLLRLSDVLVLSLDTLESDFLAVLIDRPRAVAEEILAGVQFAMAHAGKTRVVLSAVATPDNLKHVSRVLEFAMHHSLGFHLSPEIVGTTANPRLKNNHDYAALINDVIDHKRTRRGVLGVPHYLEGIRDFTRFQCHPMLMPVIRPDGRMYYPCLESKQAEISVLETGRYRTALRHARRRFGDIPKCGDCCHIFCHMALSLLQRRPLSAVREQAHWRR